MNSPKSETDPVERTKDYYILNDEYYRLIWGGEDIHIGLFEEPLTIRAASQRTVMKMAAMIGDKGPAARVLDLGSGYGGVARYLVTEHQFRVDCLNLSEIQNERNRAINRKLQLDGAILVFDGNYDDPFPFEDRSYDIVWCQDTLIHSTARNHVFNEIDRVLKPGGYYIITDIMRDEHCPKAILKEIYQRLHVDDLIDLYGIDLGTFELYRKMANELGWLEIGILDLSYTLEIHYTAILKEIEKQTEDLLTIWDEEMLAMAIKGVEDWIGFSKNHHLRWGIMHFQKPY